MSETTPRLNLPLIGDHSQKHIVMNAALMRLESLVQAQALSRTVTAPPASPAEGDSYIVPTGATWGSIAAGAFVRAIAGTWESVDFPIGGRVYIADEKRFVIRTSAGWAAIAPTHPPLWPMKSLLGPGGLRIGPMGAGVPGTTTVTANRLYMLPVILPYDLTLTVIGLRLTTAASGHMRLGLYRDAQGHPGALVCESSALSTTTTGLIDTAMSQILIAGVYWLAVVFDAAPAVTSHTSTGLGRDAGTSAPVSGYYRSFAYAALPADESAQAYTATTAEMPTVMIG